MNVAAGAFLAVGVAVVVVAAPVAGAFIGAAVTTNAIAGGVAGFTLGALALPVPFAALTTKDDPENGKSRLRRMAEEVVDLYKSIGGMFAGMVSEAVAEPFKKKPAAFVPYDNSDDPFRVNDLSPAFDTVAVKAAPQVRAKPELKLVVNNTPPRP